MINHFGRRTIFLWGLAAIFISLMIVGFIGLAPSTNTGASWAVGAFLLIYTLIYDSTIGPLTCESTIDQHSEGSALRGTQSDLRLPSDVIVPEAPSSRLRHKTTVLARNMYNVTCE